MTETMMRIKQECELQQLSQRNLAKLMKTSEATVSRWMNGTRRPKIDDVEKMVKVLGMRILLFK